MFRTLQTLQSFLDSRFKILGETFWIQLLSRLDSWIQDSRFKILGETFWIQILLDSRFKIQDSRRNFLNPDPPSRLTSPGFKIQDSEGNFLNPKPPGFKIQDSRRNFLNQNYPFRLPSSRPKAWDSKSFPQNLESWIQKTLQSLQSFLDSRFKILGETFWIQIPLLDLHLLDSRFKILRETFWIPSLLDSRFKILGETFWIRIILSDFPHPDPRLGIQKVSLRILNLESWIQKTLQSLQSFLYPSFENCGIFIYIYILKCVHVCMGTGELNESKHINCGIFYIYIYIY